ncbi:uncharacterized protein DS421_18g610610 [Arachis hypogaea]|nr:uncharacterized protein DS421_18g610610 [Arachis hypogaea]
MGYTRKWPHTHSSLIAAHTLTHLTPSSSQHTHPDLTEKERKKRGREKRGNREKRREEEGGSYQRRATTRGERAAPHHRRPGARRSCPVASPPSASSSLLSRRHQRPEPTEMCLREETSAREETEEGLPPFCLYAVELIHRRALSLLSLSFNRRHAKSSSPLLIEKRELEERETGWARGAAVNRGLFRHRCCVAVQVNLGCYWSCWCRWS